MMYQKGGSEVTEKTDKQANKLVKKRTKIRKRRDKIEDREKKGKKVIFKKIRKRILNKREDKVQDKINKNPTAKKWKKDGEAEAGQRFLSPMRRKKFQTGGEVKGKKVKAPLNENVDYNSALSALGLIPALSPLATPGMGKATKAAIAAKKAGKKAIKKSTKKGSVGEKLKKFQKKIRRQTGGTFNTGQGSFIEPGMEQI